MTNYGKRGGMGFPLDGEVATVIVLSSLVCVLFTVATGPGFSPEGLFPFLGTLGLSRARLDYWWRFACSAFLMGLVPIVAAVFFRWPRSRLGFVGCAGFMKKPAFLASLPLAVAIGALGGATPQLAAYYPYARDIPQLVRAGGAGQLAGHLVAYGLLYYLPWELFFRGFLLMPLLHAAGGLPLPGERERAARLHTAGMLRPPAPGEPVADARPGSASIGMVTFAIMIQTIPSTMLHFGHPLSELLSAIPAGIVFGCLAAATGSIVPGTVLHALVGFGTDTFIVLRAIGVL